MYFPVRMFYKSLVFMIGLLLFFLMLMSYMNIERKTVQKRLAPLPSPVLKATTVFEGSKYVHLDLKGAPPKLDYYRRIFPMFNKMGVDGLLIEYEDMFPYSGDLRHISALNAYSLDDVKEINDIAESNNLKVIPLIQTFGHMEFVLKLVEYKHLREVNTSAQAICPSNPKAIQLLSQIIEQILDAHPQSDTIHIGCDEVYHLGKCWRCYSIISRKVWHKFDLFLDHVKMMSEIVQKYRANMTVLIWDDMLRNIDDTILLQSDIGKYVTPVVWSYVQSVYDTIDHGVWVKYSKVFSKVWIASAFKGGTSSNEYITDEKYYLENHKSWLEIVDDYKDRIKFQGIFLTGWQRYDHFAVLCDLLPVAMPSLAMCMRLLYGFKDYSNIPFELGKILECENLSALMKSDFNNAQCLYPGGEILVAVFNLKRLKEMYSDLLNDSRVKGWMTDFNVKYTFSNPDHVDTATRELGRMKMELAEIEATIVRYMNDIYDNYTIDEWTETYIRPFEKEIIDMWERKEKLLSRDVWPNRPINKMNGK